MGCTTPNHPTQPPSQHSPRPEPGPGARGGPLRRSRPLAPLFQVLTRAPFPAWRQFCTLQLPSTEAVCTPDARPSLPRATTFPNCCLLCLPALLASPRAPDHRRSQGGEAGATPPHRPAGVAGHRPTHLTDPFSLTEERLSHQHRRLPFSPASLPPAPYFWAGLPRSVHPLHPPRASSALCAGVNPDTLRARCTPRALHALFLARPAQLPERVPAPRACRGPHCHVPAGAPRPPLPRACRGPPGPHCRALVVDQSHV